MKSMFKRLPRIFHPYLVCPHHPIISASYKFPIRGLAYSAKKAPVPEVLIVKNEAIKYPELRVVFKSEDGKDQHKIMSRIEVTTNVNSKEYSYLNLHISS